MREVERVMAKRGMRAAKAAADGIAAAAGPIDSGEPPAGPPPEPAGPRPPLNAKQMIAKALKEINDKVQSVNDVVNTAQSYAAAAADPGAFIAGKAGGWVDEKMSSLCNGLAAAMPPFPAATRFKMALGTPHAH